MLACFSMKCCSMQVNNAGISGIVIEDSDLITTILVNRGVRKFSSHELVLLLSPTQSQGIMR